MMMRHIIGDMTLKLMTKAKARDKLGENWIYVAAEAMRVDNFRGESAERRELSDEHKAIGLLCLQRTRRIAGQQNSEEQKSRT